MVILSVNLTSVWLRSLSQSIRSTKKSVLLLGPRQVGKSTLIKSLKPDLTINFAVEGDYFDFLRNPRELEERLETHRPKTIFIDEVQRIPRITNSIQGLLDNDPKLKFFLTGSSARKLKRGRANLLPGRVIHFELCPLSILELGNDWNESEGMAFGTLPGVYSQDNPLEKKRLLRTYAQTYLKEEIVAESLVKNTESFARFLMASSRFAGNYLDLSKLAKASKSPRQNVFRHFEILEDTLLVQRIFSDPELLENGVDLVKHPRFFYFDVGVLNALLGSFEISLDRIGKVFEHMVYNQIRNAALSQEKEFQVFNFRTRGGFEVDFVFKIEGDYFAIECKASDDIERLTITNLLKVKEYYKKIKLIALYRGKRSFSRDGVTIGPLSTALKEMGL